MGIDSELRNYFHNIEDNVNQVRQYYKVTAEDIERDIKILKEWIKKEMHLPQDLEDNFFEKMLLFNKFRMEQAKRQIDAFFTIKTADPELFEGLEKFRLIKQTPVICVMPNLLPNNEALLIWRLNLPDPELYNFPNCLKNWILLSAWTIKYFYISGMSLIIDFEGNNLGHIKRINLNYVLKMVNLLALPFRIRVGSIDVINAPSYAFPLINICKACISSKLANKIHIHSSLDGLAEKIDLKYLPKDIGGTGEWQEDIIKRMDELIEKDHDHLKSLKDIRSDESKRIGEPVLTYQDFGPQGTFKQINID